MWDVIQQWNHAADHSSVTHGTCRNFLQRKHRTFFPPINPPHTLEAIHSTALPSPPPRSCPLHPRRCHPIHSVALALPALPSPPPRCIASIYSPSHPSTHLLSALQRCRCLYTAPDTSALFLSTHISLSTELSVVAASLDGVDCHRQFVTQRAAERDGSPGAGAWGTCTWAINEYLEGILSGKWLDNFSLSYVEYVYIYFKSQYHKKIITIDNVGYRHPLSCCSASWGVVWIWWFCSALSKWAGGQGRHQRIVRCATSNLTYSMTREMHQGKAASGSSLPLTRWASQPHLPTNPLMCNPIEEMWVNAAAHSGPVVSQPTYRARRGGGDRITLDKIWSAAGSTLAARLASASPLVSMQVSSWIFILAMQWSLLMAVESTPCCNYEIYEFPLLNNSCQFSAWSW